MTNRTPIAAVVLAVVLALAGCTSSHEALPGTGGAPAAGQHVQADVDFASMMIPHHQQAVEMSDMLLAKQGIDARVVDLATRIKAAQTPEIAEMGGWLAGWGQDPGPSGTGGMSGMDHGGTMSQAEMDDLDRASGDQAARLFLTGMIEHHRGAVTMAQSELDSGRNPDAQQLARDIISTQQAEIGQMTELLAR